MESSVMKESQNIYVTQTVLIKYVVEIKDSIARNIFEDNLLEL